MPSTDSPEVIIARFLKSNNYHLTLDAFIEEAGLPPDAGSASKDDLTIEKILEEKKVFDLSLKYEKTGQEDGAREWSLPAPSNPTIVSTLPSSANLLHVSVEPVWRESPDGSISLEKQQLLAVSADRRLHLLETNFDLTLTRSISNLHDSPILSCLTLKSPRQTTVSSSMSGQVLLFDHETQTALSERRDHKKYVVKIALWQEDEFTLVATAGWDAKVFLYSLARSTEGHYNQLPTPLASINLPTNPESLLFVKEPSTERLFLLLTRRDSTSLYYYGLASLRALSTLPLLGTQSLAPYSNAWIAFSPSALALHPMDPTLLAIATSAVPHMKLLIVRLLFPPEDPSAARSATQAAQTQATLARQNREEAAILIHVSTLAPQTPYSTPQVAWRPDGSGVWVNGDDGVVRGVEARTGKVVKVLSGGHEAGSKVRSLWAGLVGNKEEWVVSGGFDRRLVVWRVKEEEGGSGEGGG